MKTIIKLCVVNMLIALVAVVLYSPGFIGLWFGQSPMRTLLTIGVGVVLAVVLVFGNMFIMAPNSRKVKVTHASDYDDMDDYNNKLDDFEKNKIWADYVRQALKQNDRIAKKINMISIILGQFFDVNELSYKSFMNTVKQVEQAYLNNVRTMINRMTIFDYDDYAAIGNQSKSCAEHIQVVASMISTNAKIIEKVDTLLVEVSKLTDSSTDINNMPAILDLEELIGNVKYYKD